MEEKGKVRGVGLDAGMLVRGEGLSQLFYRQEFEE